VAAEYKKPPVYAKTLEQYCYWNRWVERIEAYRTFLDEERRGQFFKELSEADNTHVKYARLLSGAGIQWFVKNAGNPDALTPELALKCVDVGIRIERLIYQGHESKMGIAPKPRESTLNVQVEAAFQTYVSELDSGAKAQMTDFGRAFINMVRTRVRMPSETDGTCSQDAIESLEDNERVLDA
jgi:hypothetical protein